ncbi:MAG TPA: molybdate ABC transporter substrate-binding protein [Planctomycetaceae bacterium]|nr:molybdate ABC transporter substrate-binding protein [Planctomycetaceae bacterium]
MGSGFEKLVAASAVVVAALVGFLMWSSSTSPPPAQPGEAQAAKATPATLLLYCAAGLQPPVSEIITAYEQSHPVTFETKIGGSGSLVSQIVVGGGDLFLAADRLYLDESSQRKLALEIVPIAYQYPVILVQKGNPKKISGLNDLLKADVRLSLADPKRAAISKAVSVLLQKGDNWEPLWKKAIIHRETVNEVGNDVKLAAADAGLVWNATAAQYPDMTVVRVPEFDRSKSEIVVGLLSSSKDPRLAQEFISYLTDPQHGLPVFARHGYELIGSTSATSH